jgi:DNA invertase Pin-like site-specific DNA recombinase
MRTGVYLRISEDHDGTSTATARQLEDCRKLAESRDWTVANVFEDSDLSAYNRHVVRPEFERMIAAVKAREIDVVLAWKLDRLTRRLRDFSALDEACEAAGARVVTVVDAIDTSTSAGRVVASIMVSLARAESENISLRVTRKHEELAKAGRPSAGGSRAFGYSQDRMTIVEDEAAMIRAAVDRIMAGESTRGICREWEGRGIVSTTGKSWKPGPLKRMLMSPHLSAQRDRGGVLTAGCWPAILTPEQTTRLAIILSDPGRRLNQVGNARSYLLSGFLRCGSCGEPLVARPRVDHARRYVCATGPGLGNCGKLARMAGPVEDVVRDRLFAALDGPDLRAALADAHPEHDDGGLLVAIAEDEAQLRELAVDYANRTFTKAEYFTMKDTISGRIQAARKQLRQRTRAGVLADATDVLRGRWEGGTLEWRRTLIASLIEHIVIMAAVKGDNRFNPALVRVIWRY